MRLFRSIVVFPVFGLLALLPKVQILWWSLGHGLAFDHPAHGHDDGGADGFLDDMDDYSHGRLG